ncbi:hypothetical protein BTA51_04905 [Hahella sp. CCB-MM4]|uniref:transglutaminase-like domain-containing protein n=1 Tax=Hahella sp. (strain CCB-MM4) TaxID=1926491 RepID=UPI000BD9EFCE|nr:transglutaminase-like domain-containing protein [Hahella sp. CCB-MM4]OZG74354.1 hypothetical protein BTA51_04905 [Hahella sp. CCB-MM4]
MKINLGSAKEKNSPAFYPASRVMRVIAGFVLFVVSFVWYTPYVYASYRELTSPKPLNQLEVISPLSAALKQLQEEALTWRSRVSNSGGDVNVDQKGWQELARYIDQLEPLNDQFQDLLEQDRKHLEDKLLTKKALERQNMFSANFNQQMEEIVSTLEDLQNADNQDQAQHELDKLTDLLAYPLERASQSYSNDFDFVAAPPRDIYLNQSQVEALVGYSGEPAVDPTVYLSTDSATQTTDEVQALLDEVGEDPLTLYKWVHDNIRWLPSYGVMQGASYTLEARQGNAFDTASLLIALLRKSGVPARYVYGTVALPTVEVQNWIGDVRYPEAVANLLSQGGIPHRQISYGGALEETELEHVWVEAQIDGKWISLDPSFKRYTYTEGVDLKSAIPFDGESFLTQVKQGSIVNEEEGWVQGINSAFIEEQFTSFNAQLQDYLETNYAEATLEQVLGSQKIQPSTALSISEIQVPYLREETRQVAPALPSSLFYKFRLQLGSVSGGVFDPEEWGAVIAELEDLTPNLVGHRLAISFRPSTAEDEAIIASYIPEGITSVDELPSQLPANLIRMVGEITKDGEVVATTPVMSLGQAIRSRLGFISPQAGWKFSENSLVAGEYQAVGIDMQGMSSKQLTQIKTDLEEVEAKARSENYNGLTKHNLVGNILQSGIIGYMAMTYALDQLAAWESDVVSYRSPSYGTFGTNAQVTYYFGAPRQYLFAGMVMDVDRIQSNTESKNNCYEDWLAFNRTSGIRSSAFESQIPEMMFSTNERTAEGVSTVKALAIAMAQGQRIYTLTQANSEQLSAINIDDGARNEIRRAIQEGFEVTVHQSPITVNGWKGSGYSIINPQYGVGAYRISGGENGGIINIPSISSLFGLTVALSADSSSSSPSTNLFSNIATILTEIVNGLTSHQSWMKIAVNIVAALFIGWLISFIIVQVLVALSVTVVLAEQIATLIGGFMGLFAAFKMLGVFK